MMMICSKQIVKRTGVDEGDEALVETTTTGMDDCNASTLDEKEHVCDDAIQHTTSTTPMSWMPDLTYRRELRMPSFHRYFKI